MARETFAQPAKFHIAQIEEAMPRSHALLGDARSAAPRHDAERRTFRSHGDRGNEMQKHRQSPWHTRNAALRDY